MTDKIFNKDSPLNEILDKIEIGQREARSYFFIFDIDGTLRPDEIEALDHRHPKIPPQTAQKLKDLHLHPAIDMVILTARSYVDMFKSNFPKDIKKYCGCGKQILDNEILRYPREEFQRSYDETVIFIDILKDILGKALTSKIDFLVTPGDFALYFSEIDYKKSKEPIMNKINLVLEHSSRWAIMDMGKELVFIDNKYHYDKGNAAQDIMDGLNLDQLTQVFMFGDSQTDYRAMLGLRSYQKQYPYKRLKVSNISVGTKLDPKLEAIDFQFTSYEVTLRFIDELHKKIFKQEKK